MPVSSTQSLLIILISAATVFFTRAFPFLVFRGSKPIPKMTIYLGKVLPPAVIGLLVVYCYRNVSFISAPHGLPELIAGAVVVLLYLWKRNNLLSIGVGTVLYMFLVQAVFV